MLSKAERIIEEIFHRYHQPGAVSVEFTRDDITTAASNLGEQPPKNMGEPIYMLRYMKPMPTSVKALAPPDTEWVIRGRGPARYAFEAVAQAWFAPDASLPVVTLPDATPGLVAQHSMDDEQALLARLRHNQLIALATGLVVAHLQSHVRSSVASGQVEIDDLYVGVDAAGNHYLIPLEAKTDSGAISLIQIEQGADFCLTKQPELACIPLGAKLQPDGSIYLFRFDKLAPGTPPGSGVTLNRQMRFKLV